MKTYLIHSGLLAFLLALATSSSFGQITQGAVFTDSLAVAELAKANPVLGSTTEAGWVFGQSKLGRYQEGKLVDTLAFGSVSPSRNNRMATRVGDKFYVLSWPWPGQVIEVDLNTRQSRVLALHAELEGVAYDIFSYGGHRGSYSPAQHALLYYITPIGDEQDNHFNPTTIYQGGYVGKFAIEADSIVLREVWAQRDPIYQEKVLPHLHWASVMAHPRTGEIYAGQAAIPTLQVLSPEGELTHTFGQRGLHIEQDTIISLPFERYTGRRESIFNLMATLYLDLYIDAEQNWLYRTYRIGKTLPIPPLVGEPSPQLPKGVNACAYDPYLDSVSAIWYPLTYGLQIYDLNTESPQLLYDLPIGHNSAVLSVEDNRVYLLGRPEDRGRWIYELTLPNND